MQTEPYRPLVAVRSGEGFVEYDAGAYTTAKIRMKFKAKAGTRVRLIWAECYSVADRAGNRFKSVRDAFNHPTAEMGGAFDSLVFYLKGSVPCPLPRFSVYSKNFLELF